jgi:hypothetical protein
VTAEDRLNAFKSFWALGDFNLQQAFICGSVTEKPAVTHVIRRCQLSTDSENSSLTCGTVISPQESGKKYYKNFTRSFTLQTASGAKFVCKQVFLKTLQISNGRLHRALASSRTNGGVAKTDRRGNHVKTKVTDDQTASVMNHIQSFPRYVSHYTRNHQEHRQFLAPNLNIITMYKDYKESCIASNTTAVKESYYRHVFETRFNLHFHQPLKDTCQKCDRFNMLLKHNPDEETVATQKELHLRKAEKVRATLNQLKTTATGENLVITFDLQKTLICPVITTGVAYYKRQLSVYNLGIHNMADNSAAMFMWDESVASRGASEIGSCLLRYVEEKVHAGAKNVTCFSDSCGGQNRNFKIATLMSYLVQTHGIDMTLHFMQSGHSFLPNDADFGVIEKAKKTSGSIYIPEHWMQVVAAARKRNPFRVVNMHCGDFIDLAAMSKFLVNRKKDTDGHVVSWLNIQSIRFTRETPQFMKIQYVCDPEGLWYTVDLSKLAGDPGKIIRIMAPAEPRRLNVNKKKDLMSLKPHIPPAYHGFYDALLADDADDNDVLPLEDDLLEISECESEEGDDTVVRTVTSKKLRKTGNRRNKQSVAAKPRQQNKVSKRSCEVSVNGVSLQTSVSERPDEQNEQLRTNDTCISIAGYEENVLREINAITDGSRLGQSFVASTPINSQGSRERLAFVSDSNRGVLAITPIRTERGIRRSTRRESADMNSDSLVWNVSSVSATGHRTPKTSKSRGTAYSSSSQARGLTSKAQKRKRSLSADARNETTYCNSKKQALSDITNLKNNTFNEVVPLACIGTRKTSVKDCENVVMQPRSAVCKPVGLRCRKRN